MPLRQNQIITIEMHLYVTALLVHPQRLSALKPLTKKVRCAALEPNNVGKNRNVDIIPGQLSIEHSSWFTYITSTCLPFVSSIILMILVLLSRFTACFSLCMLFHVLYSVLIAGFIISLSRLRMFPILSWPIIPLVRSHAFCPSKSTPGEFIFRCFFTPVASLNFQTNTVSYIINIIIIIICVVNPFCLL